MRAAKAIGFEPHVFSLATHGGVREADFGTVHFVPSPFRPHRVVMAGLNVPLIAHAVVNFARQTPGIVAIHGIHIYAASACMARDRLGGSAGPRVVSSVFTTMRDESRAKRRGIVPEHGVAARAWYHVDDTLVALSGVPIERKAYRAADVVFLNYESVRRRFEESYGKRRNVLKLRYSTDSGFTGLPTAPAPAEIAAARAAGRPIIVAASRHDPRKGVQTLLEALRVLQRRGHDYFAVFTGGGVLLRRHRALAASLGIADRVLFTGAVDDPLPYIAAADVFVQPSLQEGSGSVAVLEALHAGVAVVASACDGLLEDIDDGVDGLLSPPGDVATLASSIERLLGDDALRRSIAAAGRRTFDARFSARAMVDSLAAGYASIGIWPDAPTRGR